MRSSRKQREWWIITTLLIHERMSIRELATVTKYPEPRISESVARLVAEGELQAEKDGKAKVVSLAKHPMYYQCAGPWS